MDNEPIRVGDVVQCTMPEATINGFTAVVIGFEGNKPILQWRADDGWWTLKSGPWNPRVLVRIGRAVVFPDGRKADSSQLPDIHQPGGDERG